MMIDHFSFRFGRKCAHRQSVVPLFRFTISCIGRQTDRRVNSMKHSGFECCDSTSSQNPRKTEAEQSLFAVRSLARRSQQVRIGFCGPACVLCHDHDRALSSRSTEACSCLPEQDAPVHVECEAVKNGAINFPYLAAQPHGQALEQRDGLGTWRWDEVSLAQRARK